VINYRERSMARVAAIVVLLVVAAVAAGCGSREQDANTAGPRAEPDGLLAALAAMRATEYSRAYIRYGDLEATGELAAADRLHWAGLHEHGLGRLDGGDPTMRIKAGLGFDPLAMRQVVAAGKPDHLSTILWGDYDVDRVNERFADRKIHRTDRDGATEWTTDADGHWDLHGPLGDIVWTNDFNNVRTQPGSFAFSPYRSDLAWVTDPGQHTLARDTTTRALAECLGDDVVAATITTKFDAPLAVGVRLPKPPDVVEVICVAPGSAERAATLRDQVADLLAHGQSPQFREPWSQRLPNASAEVTGDGLVRVTSGHGRRQSPRQVLDMVETTEIRDFVGTT
jgi:hypothetical protein